MTDEMKARARNTDPGTSHAAAEKVEREGKAGSQRAAVLKYLRLQPGSTSGESAAALGIDRYTPSRRLPELRDGGFVRTGPPRTCKVQGSTCLTWYPVDPTQYGPKPGELFR